MATTQASSSSFDSSLHLARTLTTQAHAHLSLRPERAFPLYLQSAQLYSLLVRQAPAHGLTQQIKKEWAAVLDLAGKTKLVIKQRDGQGGVRADVGQWKRCDSNQQTLVLSKSSDLSTPVGNLRLPVWTLPPPSSIFTTSTVYIDPCPPSIPLYLEAAYATPPYASTLDTLWDHDVRPEMIIQSQVRNCSLVAGIQAAVGWNNRFGGVDRKNLLAPLLYPSSPSGLPVRSASGQYVFKLTINGSSRSLSVDSQLLFSLRGREPIGISLLSLQSLPFSTTESEQRMLKARGMEYALGLIEKGWMKLMGGWDSGGSNSSVDLAGLTGWIPELIRFHGRDFQRENVWRRVKDGFTKGKCIMTLGTGALSPLMERSTGLISRHDYAIIDLIESNGERFVQMVNPWNRPGDRLTLEALPTSGARTDGLASAIEALEIIHEGSEEEGEKEGDRNKRASGETRLFVLPWETVITTFDALYLNWDPLIFHSRCTVHSSWSREVEGAPMRFLTTPRFTLDFQARGQDRAEIWVWLSRHLSTVGVRDSETEDEDEAKPKEDLAGGYTGPSSQMNDREWIGLDGLEDETVETVNVGDISSSKVELTNCSHILVKLQPTGPHSRHTLFVLREGSTEETRFTLNVFSTGSVGLTDGPPDLPYSVVEEGEFSSRSAGGNVRFPTFMNNPMYRLVVHPRSELSKDERAELRMVLESCRGTEGTEVGKDVGPMNVKLVWGKGERVVSLIQADVVGDSGPYREKTTICRIPSLAPGVYTMIASLYSAGSLGSFKLGVQCSSPIDLQPIALEGAGMFSRAVRGDWNSKNNLVYKLSLVKSGSIFLRLQPVSPSAIEPPGVTPPVRLSVVSRTADGTGMEVTSSGPYTDELSGAVTPRVRVGCGDYDVRVCAYGSGRHGRFLLVAYGDTKLEIVSDGGA